MRRCCNQSGSAADMHAGLDHPGMNSNNMIKKGTSAAEVAHGLKVHGRAAAHAQDCAVRVGVWGDSFCLRPQNNL